MVKVIVISPKTIIFKQMCYNVIDILGSNLSIIHISCLFLCHFICEQYNMNAKTTLLNQAT